MLMWFGTTTFLQCQDYSIMCLSVYWPNGISNAIQGPNTLILNISIQPIHMSHIKLTHYKPQRPYLHLTALLLHC